MGVMNDHGRAFLCGRRAGCPDDCFPGLNMKRLAVSVVALFSVSAHAAIGAAGPSSTKSGTSVVLNYNSTGQPIDSVSRSIAAGTLLGELLVKDSIKVAGPAGDLAVTTQRVTTAAEVAGSIARGFVKGAGVVGIGVMAYDLVTAVRGRMNGSVAEADVGKSPTDVSQQRWCVYGKNDSSGNPLYCDTSAGGAVQKYENYVRAWEISTNNRLQCGSDVNGNPVYGSVSVVLKSVHSSGTAYYYDEHQVCSGPSRYFDVYSTFATVNKLADQVVKQCEGGASVGADGKCPTGIYTPVTATQLQDMIKSAVTQAVAKDHSLSPAADIKETGSMSVTGSPSTQTGKPTTKTTTSPTGSTTETTTPTYNISYGPTISWTTTNTTVTNVTQGGTTTTTTTTETKPTEEATDGMCKLYPDSLACQKVGDPPKDEIPKTDRTVSVAQESVSLPEGCPADIPLPGGKVLSYASACDAAQKIRPVVIAAGVLSALLIAVAALRSS